MGTISAEELRNLANGGWADSIKALFPTGEDETTKTFFLNLPAEGFGVPDDGYMVLLIDSDGFSAGIGTHWEATRYVSGDIISFTGIPMMRVGSSVTVTVLCYTADGILISSGFSSGTAKDGGIPMEIGIIGSARIVLGSNSAPNGNTTEQGGTVYDVIEYAGTGLQMAAVNPNTGAVMKVTVNGTLVSTTTESSVTAPLSDGYNTIELTVTKGDNTPVVTTRNIYVVKKLVVPVITMSGGTANGETVTSGGKSYQVVEYTGTTKPKVTITNSYDGSSASYEAKLGTTVLSTACPSTITNQELSDGFNAVTATLSEPYCDTLKDEKYYYVVKALTEDDVSITPSDYSTAAIEGDYEVLYFSYLADTITLPNVSVDNTYTGDATTPELGDSYLEITVTGATTVAETSSLSGQDLNCGDCTITVNLCKFKCSPASVEKKVRVKIKPVTVSMSSITLDYDTKDFHRWVTQSSYVQASNADGTDSIRKTVYEMNHVRYGADGWNPEKRVSVSAVLTAPDSSFRFWTTEGRFTYDDNPGEEPTSVGSYDKPWTLDDLRDTANRSVDQYVGVSRAASQYTFTLNVTD